MKTCDMEKPSKSEFQEALEQAVAGNRIDSGTALYVRFNRDHKPGTEGRSKLREDRRHVDVRKLQREWAERKLSKMKVAKTHLKKYQKVDGSKGKLLDFGALVESFGIHYDRARAIRLATNLASRAAKMGGQRRPHGKMHAVHAALPRTFK